MNKIIIKNKNVVGKVYTATKNWNWIMLVYAIYKVILSTNITEIQLFF